VFLSGVIEGFYGRAWTAGQRIEMLEWLRAAGMNTFVYGPKDDIKIRARWRELYDTSEAAALKSLSDAARVRGITFMAALAPCLDVTYSDPAELEMLKARLDQLIDLGIRNFALLFDDIPSRMKPEDEAAFASFADAQCHLANAAFAHIRRKATNAVVLFCPTEYCAAFAKRDVPGSAYLNTLGKTLDPGMGIFWTGPDIVSETIPASSLREIGRVLRRKPVIWDNFHANDYDIRRVYLGPLGGRAAEILPLIDGIITNPNNEFEANFVAIHSTGAFARGGYDEAAAFDAALRAWQPRFKLASTKATVPLEELRLLAELHYQPFRCGPEIETQLAAARRLLGEHRPDTNAAPWRARHGRLVELRERIRHLFEHLTELENRDLFYALNQYLWEAREEITHLVSYLDWLAGNPPPEAVFPDRERIYNFYRRGFTVAVQEMLKRDPDGRYRHGA
jgi:protein O-GlcNAcase/histone acetyltransferase